MKNFKNYLSIFAVVFLFSFIFQANVSAYDLEIKTRSLDGSKIAGLRYENTHLYNVVQKWRSEWKKTTDLEYFPDVTTYDCNTTSIESNNNYSSPVGHIKYTIKNLDNESSPPVTCYSTTNILGTQEDITISVDKDGLYFVTAELTLQFDLVDDVVLVDEVLSSKAEGLCPWTEYAPKYLYDLDSNVDKDDFVYELLKVEYEQNLYDSLSFDPTGAGSFHPGFKLYKRYTFTIKDSQYIFVGPNGSSALFLFPWNADEMKYLLGFNPDRKPEFRDKNFTPPGNRWQEVSSQAELQTVKPVAENGLLPVLDTLEDATEEALKGCLSEILVKSLDYSDLITGPAANVIVFVARPHENFIREGIEDVLITESTMLVLKLALNTAGVSAAGGPAILLGVGAGLATKMFIGLVKESKLRDLVTENISSKIACDIVNENDQYLSVNLFSKAESLKDLRLENTETIRLYPEFQQEKLLPGFCENLGLDEAYCFCSIPKDDILIEPITETDSSGYRIISSIQTTAWFDVERLSGNVVFENIHVPIATLLGNKFSFKLKDSTAVDNKVILLFNGTPDISTIGPDTISVSSGNKGELNLKTEHFICFGNSVTIDVTAGGYYDIQNGEILNVVIDGSVKNEMGNPLNEGLGESISLTVVGKTESFLEIENIKAFQSGKVVGSPISGTFLLKPEITHSDPLVEVEYFIVNGQPIGTPLGTTSGDEGVEVDSSSHGLGVTSDQDVTFRVRAVDVKGNVAIKDVIYTISNMISSFAVYPQNITFSKHRSKDPTPSLINLELVNIGNLWRVLSLPDFVYLSYVDDNGDPKPARASGDTPDPDDFYKADNVSVKINDDDIIVDGFPVQREEGLYTGKIKFLDNHTGNISVVNVSYNYTEETETKSDLFVIGAPVPKDEDGNILRPPFYEGQEIEWFVTVCNRGPNITTYDDNAEVGFYVNDNRCGEWSGDYAQFIREDSRSMLLDLGEVRAYSRRITFEAKDIGDAMYLAAVADWRNNLGESWGTYLDNFTNYGPFPILPKPNPDYNIFLTNNDLLINAGHSLSTSVVLTRIDGFSDPVSIIVRNLPDGVIATLSGQPLNPPGQVSLTFEVAPDAQLGTFGATLVSYGGGKAQCHP